MELGITHSLSPEVGHEDIYANAFEINLRPEGFVFDVGSLMAALMGLKDLRDARGLRYALVTVLVFVILAKLSGEDFMCGMAQWVAERKEELAKTLGLAKIQPPHYTTWRNYTDWKNYTEHGHKLRFCARPGFDALAGRSLGKNRVNARLQKCN